MPGALVAGCIDRAAMAGAPTIGPHTASFMTAALALDDRCGFERSPEFDLTAADVLGDLDDLDDLDDRDVPSVIAYRLDL